MRNIIDKISTIFAYILGALIIVAASPIILFFFVLFYIRSGYERLWSLLRKDPVTDLSIKKFSDTHYARRSSAQEYADSFNLLTSIIANMAKASVTDILFNNCKELSDSSGIEAVNIKNLYMSAHLKTEHAQVVVRVELETSYNPGTKQLWIYPSNNDENASANQLCAVVTILSPMSGNSIVIYDSNDIRMVVSILRGDSKYSSKGQLWGYVREKNIWLVRYKSSHGGYGIRAQFKQENARPYGFDK